MQNLYLMQRWRVRGDFYFFQGLHIFQRGDSLIKNQHVQHRQPKSTMFLVCCSEPEPNCSPTELHLSWWAPPPCWGAFGKDAVTSSITRLVKKSKLSSIYFHPESAVSTFCSWALLSCWGPQTGLTLTGKDPATLNSLDFMQCKMVLLASCPGNRLQFA